MLGKTFLLFLSKLSYLLGHLCHSQVLINIGILGVQNSEWCISVIPQYFTFKLLNHLLLICLAQSHRPIQASESVNSDDFWPIHKYGTVYYILCCFFPFCNIFLPLEPDTVILYHLNHIQIFFFNLHTLTLQFMVRNVIYLWNLHVVACFYFI